MLGCKRTNATPCECAGNVVSATRQLARSHEGDPHCDRILDVIGRENNPTTLPVQDVCCYHDYTHHWSGWFRDSSRVARIREHPGPKSAWGRSLLISSKPVSAEFGAPPAQDTTSGSMCFSRATTFIRGETAISPVAEVGLIMGWEAMTPQCRTRQLWADSFMTPS
jgi:hypothetical protein